MVDPSHESFGKRESCTLAGRKGMLASPALLTLDQSLAIAGSCGQSVEKFAGIRRLAARTLAKINSSAQAKLKSQIHLSIWRVSERSTIWWL